MRVRWRPPLSVAIVTHFVTRSLAISDDESLVVCPVTVSDHDLGATVIRLLRDQRRREFPMDFQQ